MRILTLNLKTWRCGMQASKEYSLGVGVTRLHNSSGYSCCLGQFADQIIFESERLTFLSSIVSDPATLARRLKRVYDPLFVKEDKGTYDNTALSRRLMDINDDPTTTVEEKILALKEQLAVVDCELIVLGTSNG